MKQGALLAHAVSRSFGLMPQDSWPLRLEDGLSAVARRHGLDTASLGTRIEATPALLRELAGSLTVSEAYFFRLPEQLDVVAEAVVARLSRGTGGVTIWSAGCAQGEEPYSLAMLLDARLGAAWHERVRIIGTDLSLAAIEAARRGLYSEWALRATAPTWRTRYFVDAGGGQMRLRQQTAERVSFEHLDLREHLARLTTGSIDLVLFRNVGIYLDAGTLDQLYDGFARVLRPEGMLIVAPTDPMPPAQRFHQTATAAAGVFEPVGTGREAVVSPLPTVHRAPCLAAKRPLGLERESRPAAADLQHIAALADRGEVAAALSILDDILAARPDATSARLLRGQLKLSLSQVEAAVGDLRACVFLCRDHKLARYWYALALRSAGAIDQCANQLRELSHQLASLPGDTALEDNHTCAQQLCQAIAEMQRSLT